MTFNVKSKQNLMILRSLFFELNKRSVSGIFRCSNRVFLGNLTYFSAFRRFSSDMVKKAVVFLAPGAEEMEFVIAVDVLRRGGVRSV